VSVRRVSKPGNGVELTTCGVISVNNNTINHPHTTHAVDHTPLRPCTAICSLATSPPILLTHFLCPHIARCCRMPRGAPEPEPRGGGGGASNMHWEMRRKEERVRRGLIATTGRVPKVRTCAALHKHLTHPLLFASSCDVRCGKLVDCVGEAGCTVQTWQRCCFAHQLEWMLKITTAPRSRCHHSVCARAGACAHAALRIDKSNM
jgi:hypothetical protein